MSKKDGSPAVLAKKWLKVLETIPEFKDTADSSSVEDLKKIVFQCEGNIYTVEQEKDNDEKLISAREIVKEFSAPYRDAIKVQTAKIKYALFLLDGKGAALDNREEE